MIERDDPQDKTLAALYREASREAPSAGLDARILAAARATASAPRRATNSWVNRWKIPVALAATALLTTTVTLLVLDEEAGRLDSPDSGARIKRAAPPAAAETGAQPVPAPASPAPAPASKPAEVPRKEIRKESAAPVQDASPRADREEAPRLLREAVPAAKAEAAAGAPAAAAAPAARLADSANSAERVPARTPDQWIADIRRLKQEGKTAEAEASLAEFRKLYPWYALPDDLKPR